MIHSSRARERVALVLVWALATSINIAKPVQIDDASYLENARNIVARPLHPMSGLSNWGGTPEPTHRRSPPALHFYLLAAVLAIFGESEIALHGLIAAFTAGCIALFVGIARRVESAHPVLLAALFFAGPAFIPSQNLMIEVPQLFFWLLFFRMLISSGAYALLGAASAAAAACLLKYTSIVLIPVLVVHALLRRRLRDLLYVAIPVGVLIAWSAFNYFDYGGIHLVESTSGVAVGRPGWYPQGMVGRILIRLRDWVVSAGGVAPFTLLLYGRYLRRRPVAIAAAVISIGLAGVLAIAVSSNDDVLVYRVLRAGCMANGVALLLGSFVLVARELNRGRAAGAGSPGEGATLSLWWAGGVGSILAGSPFMAVRHLVQAFPALLLLMGRTPAIVSAASPWLRRLVLVGSIGLGVSLGISDWLYADAARTQARAIAARYNASAGLERVWFAGHWGWQWYAAHAGMVQFDVAQPRLAKGDYMVAPAGWREISRAVAACLVPVERVTVPPRRWDVVRTIAPYASFYADNGRLPPWTLSRAPLLSIDVFRAERECP